MRPLVPEVAFAQCPIATSLGVLGRKWTMIILREIGFSGKASFSELQRRLPNITPRTLATRISDLEKEGIIRRVPTSHGRRRVRYDLTERGKDTLPILAAYIAYGSKHLADQVFEDGRPRSLDAIFPSRQQELLRHLLAYSRANWVRA